ncbi:MAG TPA: tripartite tricarboxylate transporter substrate-binding protein [Usitatibacter sp.]|jgi:tripartite-type tricarboxylate transporter receptor subunit TctC|nr:tripartite tricarboxylate transporter substrate-binding protein [Usitatibacter sp.]
MHSIHRRRIISAAAGALALAGVPRAFAQEKYPSKNIRVVVPTAQGGSADRLARVFDDFWGPLLKTHFTYDFFAGAAGQVGYETFIGKRERDGHNLLFGNMGPEMIMYALQNPPYKFPQDYQYFCRLDVDDSIVFASRQSKFKRIEDVVAEAKKRTVNVAVSRLPHPASIGLLALGAATGAKFNLIPYGGGNPTSIAVLNGEADCGALPIAGVIVQKDTLKVLGIFNDEHKMGALSDNAPGINKVFGTKIPNLASSRSWAVHTEFIDKHPDKFALLERTARQVFDNPKYREEYAKTGAPVETIEYGDRKLCTQYANHMVELANEYRSMLSAKKGKG